jgi:hypothetical protein
MMCSLRAGVAALTLSVVVAMCGCAAKPSAAPSPDGRAALAKMTAQPAQLPPGRRVSTLLDFESADDLTFLTSDPAGAASIDGSMSRNGSHCLLLPPGTRSISLKTPVLLQGRSFPADWTLLGGYVFAEQPIVITMTYEIGGKSTIVRSVSIGANAWVPVMIDLGALTSAASAPTAEVGTLHLQFQGVGGVGSSAIRLDDVMLVDNEESVVDTSREPRGWRVRRFGLRYIVEAATFSFTIATAQAEQGGWSVADACPARVRFTSPSPPGSMTIYSDGRMYWGGQFRAVPPGLSDAAAQARQHASPTEITVPENMGRVNRSTPGDTNNDGYNETRGTYELLATGPRIELTLTPRTPVLSRPVLEIAGLPPGEVRVTMEGRLVPGAIRLPGGELLIELPGQIQRPTLVNVKVK